jgi:glutamine synthetase
MGINPQYSAHKYGPGQNEIDFRCSEPVTAADNMVHYKTVVKTIAAQNGLYASFMPKPLADTYGSALAVILTVRKNGQNIFTLKDGAMCAEGRSFIAGVLSHIAETAVFLNPIVNSYTRLLHSSAPNAVCWSFENRNPLLRIPGQSGLHPRIEIRSADCCCNPYIAFRLLMAAGMDGIRRGLELSDDLQCTAEEKTFPLLPQSLEDAFALAEHSDFIAQQIPQEIRRRFFRETSRQIALYHAADDPAKFEEEQYFLSV